MPILRSISWPRVFAESAIIIASILLAFWLEAWWSDRQAIDDERAILTSLRAELDQVIRESAYVRTAAQAIYDSTVSLANYSIQGNLPEQNDELHRLITDFAYRINSKFATAPVLESLFYTGDLEVISNSQLRRDISEIRTELEWLRAEIERETEYFNGTVIPYLQQNADIAQLYTNESYAPGYWGDPEFLSNYPGLEPSPKGSLAELLERREFQNILLHRLTTLGNSLFQWEISEIDQKQERIQMLIDQELEKL